MLKAKSADEKLAPPHHECVVRLVVTYIGCFALLGLLGILIFLTVIALKDKDVSVAVVALLTSLSTLCGGALGALGSMLNQTRAVPQDTTQSVKIDQPANDPVPVAEQPAKP